MRELKEIQNDFLELCREVEEFAASHPDRNIVLYNCLAEVTLPEESGGKGTLDGHGALVGRAGNIALLFSNEPRFLKILEVIEEGRVESWFAEEMEKQKEKGNDQ